MTSKIEWTDETWNPVTGCTPISPGCYNCYAQRMARRLAGRHGYPDAPNHFDVTLREDRLDEPLRWRKPRRVFVCSMSDLFHKDVPPEYILRVFKMMFTAEHHTFQVLTKRPERMRRILTEWMPFAWPIATFYKYPGILPNVWLGVTVCNQDELWKVDELLHVPAAVRFVSVEPMLAEINVSRYFHLWPQDMRFGRRPKFIPGHMKRLHWIICGAETGPGKRPMQLDWARSLRDQCKAAGAPFFFKKDSDGNHTLDGQVYEGFPK